MNLRSLESKNSDIAADVSQRSILHGRGSATEITELLASQYHKNLAAVDDLARKTHAVLTKIIGAHRVSSLDPIKNYRLDLHHINAGSFDLINIQWQGSFKLAQDPQSASYIIYIVFAGSLEQQINQDRAFCCSSDTATIISPLQTIESIASEQGEVLLIAIDFQSIDTAVGKLLHRTLKQPVIFVNQIDLTCELGLSLKKFIQFLWEALTANNPTDFSSLVLGKFENAFLACLIEGLPSNYSEQLLYQTDGALAAHVRKAQAFIESHLDEDIKLGDIAAATGVCPRLLQKAFSHHCNSSPMQFIAHARLQRIRSELIQATTQIKIVDVMMHYQFTQSGKFAKQYQQLFGEKPSETLKRSIQIKQEKTQLWQQIDDTVADRVVGGSMISSQQIFIDECLRQTIEICRKSTLDSFFCADVSDVVASSVAGGALTAVSATAYAFGTSTLATTNTNTTTRQFGTSGSISLGWGTAVANGQNPKTNVSVFGIGDVVLSYTSTNYSWSKRKSTQNTSVSTGFVLAVDF